MKRTKRNSINKYAWYIVSVSALLLGGGIVAFADPSSDPGAPTVTPVGTNVACNGGNNGAISLTVGGATGNQRGGSESSGPPLCVYSGVVGLEGNLECELDDPVRLAVGNDRRGTGNGRCHAAGLAE